MTNRGVHEEMKEGLNKKDVAILFEEDNGECFNMWHAGAGYGTKFTPAQFKQATIDGTIPTSSANTRALSACVIPNNKQLQAFECRR